MSVPEYNLTEQEERLFILAGTTVKERSLKRSFIISTVLFSGIFGALSVLAQLNWLIAVFLGIYALINLLEIRRFAVIITLYRNLAGKIGGTADDCRIEQALRRNSALAVSFYIVLLAVLYLLFPAYASAGAGIATIGLLWMILRLKLAAVNTVIAYKNEIVEAGKANEAKRK